MDVVQVEGVTAAVIGLLTASGVLARKVWRGTCGVVHAVEVIVGNGTSETPGLDTRLKNVEHEVQTNSGGSLKDSVKRNEAAMGRLERVVIEVAEAVREVVVGVGEAKERAAEAVDEASRLSASLGRADVESQRRQAGLKESLDAVLTGFLEDRDQQNSQRVAYVQALQKLGIDLTDVTKELDR